MSQTTAQLIGDLVQPLGHADGTEGAPTLSFKDDEDTGLFRPGDNTLGLVTGGSTRLTIDSSGRLLVGTSSSRASAGVQWKLQLEDTSYAGAAFIGNADNANASGHLVLGKTRGGSVGSNGAVTQNDLYGEVLFAGNNGSAFNTAARISAFADGPISGGGTNDMPGRLVFATTGDGNSSPTERMRIHSTGQVEIKGGAFSVAMGGTGFQTIFRNGANEDNFIAQGASGSTVFRNHDGSEHMRLNSLGRLGIGESTPEALLEIRGASTVGTKTGHILLSGDSATNGQGPQIVFSESGSGASYAGAYIGHIRTGSNSVGNLVFGVRTTTGNANTVPEEAMRIDDQKRVGIDTTSPNNPFVVSNSGANGLEINPGASSGTISQLLSFDRSASTARALRLDALSHTFRVGSSGASDAVEIDSSGRLLVGTSTARSNFFNTSTQSAGLQIEGNDNNTSTLSITANTTANANSPQLIFAKSAGSSVGSNTLVGSGVNVGRLVFSGNDGSEFVNAGEIRCDVDGTPGANDMPGRLVFSTTADGESSPTERMRITSAGYVKITDDGSYNSATSNYHILISNQQSLPLIHFRSENGSFDSDVLPIICGRTANSGYDFLVTQSGNGADNEHRLRGDGNAYADGSWNGGGADYAEYFEWSDGNTAAEDRRGISVVLDGDKIREAVAGEEPIGVISGNPSVVGDADIERWKGKYLRDDFGSYVKDVEGNRQLNPDYNPDTEYVSRENRPEWDCVGLMGKLRIRKGQVTGARWIKMRDVSENVEEWLVR